jgi:hypothetical protein
MAKPWKLAPRFALRSPRVALGVCAALTLGLGGCRAVDNAQVDVLERELRQQEDYIYELEDYLIEYSEKLRDCRSCQPEMMTEPTSTTTTKRGGILRPPTIANDPPHSTAPRRPNGTRVVPPIEDTLTPADAFEAPPLQAPALPATGAPSVTAPAATPAAPITPTPVPSTTTPTDPAELEAPALEIGPTSNLKWEGAAPIATIPAGDEAPPYIPDPADYQLDAESSEPTVDVASTPQDEASIAATDAPPQLIAPETAQTNTLAEPGAPVLPPPSDPSRLVAQRLQIRRVFRDAPEAEGTSPRSLMVVVEALNATDEPVDANGEVSLMVMAGETQETLQRIERWDFTAEETQAAWQSSALGDGLHLELPLQSAALAEGRLELWARLVNADGVKLLARVPFSASELGPLDLSAASPASSNETSTAIAASAAHAEQAVASEATSAEQPGEVAPALVASEPAKQPAGTQWRASNEPLNAGPVVASASTVGGASSGAWTTQAPGRMPATPTPRVATASGSPRWQQGSGEAPASESPRAWTPFR